MSREVLFEDASLRSCLELESLPSPMFGINHGPPIPVLRRAKLIFNIWALRHTDKKYISIGFDWSSDLQVSLVKQQLDKATIRI